MEFENQTAFPGEILRSTIGENEILASVISRVTWDWGSGDLLISEQQPWPVFLEPTETAHGTFEQDAMIAPEGVDLFIFGHAWSPAKQKARQLELSVKGPNFQRSFSVFGQRRWKKTFFDLQASEPEPFEKIELSFKNSFGGKSEWDGLEIPFAMNPEGKGYYREKKQAVDGLLPQIELSHERIEKWSDQPTPACTGICPMSHGLRLKNAVDVEENGNSKIKKTLFNAALPYMIVPSVKVEDEFLLEGFSPNGPSSFTVPNLKLTAGVSFDEEQFERDLKIDQIGVLPDQKQIFVRYRYSFRYPLYERQIRECKLSSTFQTTL